MLLSEILNSFDSQLSQEQTWAVCYMSTKVLFTQRRENLLKRKSIRYVVDIENVQINKTGHIIVKSEEESPTTCKQKEMEIIKSLGNMLCRCLDYGLDSSMIDTVNLEPDMAELIAGMVLQQIDEQDEGFDDEIDNFRSLSKRSSCHSLRAMRCFRSFDEISRFCEARLLRKNIETGGEHYRNVLRALYVESYELKVFLDNVTESLNQASKSDNSKLKPGAASTAQECVYQWARFWLQVMHELRRGVHLKKVSQTNISPLEYEYTPFEIAKEDALLSNESDLMPNDNSVLPENAKEIILDFILSRPHGLEDASLDKDDHEEKKHREETVTNSEEKHSDFADETEENLQSSDHRKPLKVQTKLLNKIENWDASFESLLSDDLDQKEVNNGYWMESFMTPELNADSNLGSRRNSPDETQFRDQRKRLRPQRAAELNFNDDTVLGTRNSNEKEQSNLSNTKKRLAVSTTLLTDIRLDEDPRAVGTSLSEVSKIRQAIALAEVESLAGKTTKNLNIKYGKICFSCRKTKFSMFHNANQCEICRKKFCTKCVIQNVEIPDHLVNVNEDVENRRVGATNILSKSLNNLANLGSHELVTPFPCKRHSLLQMGAKNTLGGKLVNLCSECKKFMDSIITETKNTRWHVGNTLDIEL